MRRSPAHSRFRYRLHMAAAIVGGIFNAFMVVGLVLIAWGVQ